MAGNADALACVPGSSGVTGRGIFNFDSNDAISASFRTLADEGALRSGHWRRYPPHSGYNKLKNSFNSRGNSC